MKNGGGKCGSGSNLYISKWRRREDLPHSLPVPRPGLRLPSADAPIDGDGCERTRGERDQLGASRIRPDAQRQAPRCGLKRLMIRMLATRMAMAPHRPLSPSVASPGHTPPAAARRARHIPLEHFLGLITTTPQFTVRSGGWVSGTIFPRTTTCASATASSSESIQPTSAAVGLPVRQDDQEDDERSSKHGVSARAAPAARREVAWRFSNP